MSKLKAFIGETLIYGFANVFSRVFVMLLIPLYKDLGKDVYANIIMLQMIFSVLAFLLALNSGVFYYYYEYERERYRKLIFSSWFYYQIIAALLLLGGLFVFRETLSNLLIVTDSNRADLELAFVLLGVQFFPYIFNITNINLFRIQRKPRTVIIITLTEAALILGFIWIGIEFYNFGLIEIICSQIAARLMVALMFINTARLYLNIKNFSKSMLKRLLEFSWPFFIISAFSWAIISLDKFIGVDLLPNKDDIAILAFAMQLSIPIAILADMIRMAVGPFVMSIRKEEDANKSYQQVFDLSVFSGFGTLILLIIFSPLLINILADDTFLIVLEVLPLIGLASVISLIANQFAISFSLNKKNIYILLATVIGGILGFFVNFLFMADYGFIIAGISQIASYLLMAIILYFLGIRVAKLSMQLSMAFVMLAIICGYITFIYANIESIVNKEFLPMILVGIAAGILLVVTYLKFQKLSPKAVIGYLSKRK
ncbi:oligosaccharide flippase family protein [Crocinitomicaceae bacterium]|nr:oligosaccharide flippase family protein [Crocinitomicaceae bacterium]MDC0257819.1 oligosaccharide flippase family protein [Crocinitomicaceae bacterium]